MFSVRWFAGLVHMGVELAALVCGCGGAVALVLVASSLLRIAASVTNKLVGAPKSKNRSAGPESNSTGGIPEWDWDDWDDEYSNPKRERHKRRDSGAGVPSIAVCIAIILATGLVFAFGCAVVGIFAEEFLRLRMWRTENKLFVAILNIPLADLALVVMLCVMVPANFWRAAMIAFIYNVLLLVFAMFIGTVMFLVGAGIR